MRKKFEISGACLHSSRNPKKSVLRFLLVSLLGSGVLFGAVALAAPEDDTRKGMEAFNRGDTISAMRHYRRAAEQGYAPAQEKLAYILDRSGLNEEALYWFQKAAEQNNPEGQYGLGMMYLTGDGVEPDTERGLQLVRAAAEQGLFRAMRSMFYFHREGQYGLAADPELARSWLQKMADSGNQWAINMLATGGDGDEAAVSQGEQGNPENDPGTQQQD